MEAKDKGKCQSILTEAYAYQTSVVESAKGDADLYLAIPAAGVVQFKLRTGLFGRTVGGGCRTAMFTDQVRCGFLTECGAMGCGIMRAVI